MIINKPNREKANEVAEFILNFRILEREYESIIKDAAVKKLFDGSAYEDALGTITYGVTRTEYDYSVCGHPEYDAIVEAMQVLQAKKKLLEEEMRSRLKAWESNQQLNVDKAAMRTRTILIETLPVIRYEANGEVAYVNLPDKLTTKGLTVKLNTR